MMFTYSTMSSSHNARSFKRVILKLSGEALREPGSQDNISPEIVERVAKEISKTASSGIEIGVVCGGGNFWRGASASARGMDRATADYVGMMATVMNSIDEAKFETRDVEANSKFLLERVHTAYERKIEMEDSEHLDSLERHIMLNAIDQKWQEHLYAMDSLREGVQLRAELDLKKLLMTNYQKN